MITKRKATTPKSNYISMNSRRNALLAESDKINHFLRVTDETTIEYSRALARLNEINAQLYR